MKIRNESDLRRWFKAECEKAGADVLWVEAGRGGTQGLPDAVAIGGGRAFFVELKVGERKGDRVVFQMDNTQRRTLRRLQKQKMSVAVVVAEKGTDIKWSAEPNEVRVEKSDRKVTNVLGRCAHSIPTERSPIEAAWP